MFNFYLRMELFAGTVPAHNTTANIEVCMRGGVQIRLSFFSSLLYGTPAPSAERQHPEAWPASTYGHWRGVNLR